MKVLISTLLFQVRHRPDDLEKMVRKLLSLETVRHRPDDLETTVQLIRS